METAPLDNPVVRRIFRTVAILVDQPGISLDDLIEAVSQEEGVQVSSATVRRDLTKLKEWGILADRSHRKGYFLGSLSFTLSETKATLNAIRSQALDLKHPLALNAYRELSKRLEAYDLAAFVGGYPTTGVLHRVGVASRGEDEEVMLEALAEAMGSGRQVTVRRQRDPWGKGKRLKDISLFPLQFQFHDQAWYLLAEVVGERTYPYQLLRLDRLHPAVTPVDAAPEAGKFNSRPWKRLRATSAGAGTPGSPPPAQDGNTKPVLRSEFALPQGWPIFSKRCPTAIRPKDWNHNKTTPSSSNSPSPTMSPRCSTCNVGSWGGVNTQRCWPPPASENAWRKA